MKTKAVFFDMDGCLTKENYFMRFYDLVGDVDWHMRNWHKYETGEIATYHEYLQPLVKKLREKKITKNDLYEIFRDAHFVPYLRTVIKQLQDQGILCIVISCGVEELLDRITWHLKFWNGKGFDDTCIMESVYDSEGYLCDFIPKIEIHNKNEAVEMYQKKYNLKPEECLAVGDSFSDGSMFKRCSKSILFNARPGTMEKLLECYGELNVQELSFDKFTILPQCCF